MDLFYWLQSSLTILPNQNLVSNIDFGNESTHTSGNHMVANIETCPIGFPLSRPPFIIEDVIVDMKTSKLLLNKPLYRRILIKIREIFSRS